MISMKEEWSSKLSFHQGKSQQLQNLMTWREKRGQQIPSKYHKRASITWLILSWIKVAKLIHRWWAQMTWSIRQLARLVEESRPTSRAASQSFTKQVKEFMRGKTISRRMKINTSAVQKYLLQFSRKVSWERRPLLILAGKKLSSIRENGRCQTTYLLTILTAKYYGTVWKLLQRVRSHWQS